jgi:antitoxin (DNA-binding transcriptional repressor) of toxin-antitoxin stability system
MADVTIHGECDARFAKVRDGFASNFAAGKEIGASVCVTVNGKPVLDLWAGHADKARTKRGAAGGARQTRSRCAGREVLARVRAGG